MREFLASVLLCLIVALVTLLLFPMRAPAGATASGYVHDDGVPPAIAALAMLPPPAIQPVYSEPLLPVDAPIGFGWHVPPPKLKIVPVPRPAAQQRLLAEAQRSLGKGARDLGVRRTLWCADAINKWLDRIGVTGTGSALARSFRDWGVAAKPAPGIVALKPRRGGSGHVVVLKEIKGKVAIAISPNHRGRVREARYPLRVFTAFRRPA